MPMTENKTADSGLKAHKMPQNSMFYDKVIPILFIVLGVVTVGLIVFALAVLTGIVRWA
jgi:hypothetical protein